MFGQYIMHIMVWKPRANTQNLFHSKFEIGVIQSTSISAGDVLKSALDPSIVGSLPR